MDNLGSTLIRVGIGACLTWLISFRYYKKAGDKLKQEAIELQGPTDLVLHGLENAGLVRLKRDAARRVTGLLMEIRAPVTGLGMTVISDKATQHKSLNHGVTQASDLKRAG